MNRIQQLLSETELTEPANGSGFTVPASETQAMDAYSAAVVSAAAKASPAVVYIEVKTAPRRDRQTGR